MAESGGLPGWVEAWVGKVVQVHVHGDPDPLFGVLEDWDQRGVVCCGTRRTWSASPPLASRTSPRSR
jgi:hypothetical protein